MSAQLLIISKDPFLQPQVAGVYWSAEHKAWVCKKKASTTAKRPPKRKTTPLKKKRGDVLSQVTDVAFILFVVMLVVSLLRGSN